MVEIFCDHESSKDTFTFTFSTRPSPKFCFDQPKSNPAPTNRPFKRRRALSDVDGDGNEGRKKRRLRLHLFTSRLSRPFSQPASNIIIRGFSKIAVWGPKHRTHNKILLRKAAIMNRVRLRMDAMKDLMRLEQERRRERLMLREILIQKPRTHEMPLPPSPLGLSNYDALDLEDEMSDHDHDCEDGDIDRISTIYSDFNIMDPITAEGEDYEYLDALDGIPEHLLDTPPSPPEEESIVEMLREKVREGDSYFVQLRDHDVVGESQK